MYLQYQKRISIEFHYKFQNNESKIGRKKKLEKKEKPSRLKKLENVMTYVNMMSMFCLTFLITMVVGSQMIT